MLKDISDSFVRCGESLEFTVVEMIRYFYLRQIRRVFREEVNALEICIHSLY